MINMNRWRPLLLSLGVALSAAAPSHADETRDTMHLVYAALAEMLPAALDEAGLDDAASLERVGAALTVLERSAQVLSTHGAAGTAEFAGLARSFESNIVLLRQSLEMGHYNEFRYLALDLTQNCVSCHSRLPADSDFAFSRALVEKVDSDLYAPLDRAQLQLATRQFDAAMDTLEGIMADPETLPLDLELDGVLFDYLTVGLTVTRDAGRLLDGLGRLLSRDDLPYYLARYVDTWRDHVRQFAGQLRAEPSLAVARALFAQATALSPVPSSQVRVVYDLVVSAMLRRLVEADAGLTGAELGEVYWMLGVISIRTVNPRPGVPHTELLLDAAIRAAPETETARHSYALLEEYNRVSFAGIPTAELPEPVLDLEQLRRLAGVGKGR